LKGQEVIPAAPADAEARGKKRLRSGLACFLVQRSSLSEKEAKVEEDKEPEGD
jgi:hypothetical protein